MPPDLDAFDTYMDKMLGSDEIAVAPFQRELGRHVLSPRVGPLPGWLFLPAVPLTTGLLPAVLRDAYGLELTATDRMVFASWRWAARGLRAALPRAGCWMPQSRRAYARTEVAS